MLSSDHPCPLPNAPCRALIGPPVPPASQVWDLRKNDEPFMVLKGHTDTVTGLRTSPDGTHLISNSMDNTLRAWDMRPYAPQNRCVKLFTGGWDCVGLGEMVVGLSKGLDGGLGGNSWDWVGLDGQLVGELDG